MASSFSPTAFVDEWPIEDLSDVLLYEIADGRVVEKPNSAYSMWIASQLASSMSKAVKQTAGGTLLLHALIAFDTINRRRPDLVFFVPENWPAHTPPPRHGDCALIPDLAAEVLSPTNRYEEVLRKLGEYFRYGVREVWLVAPAERIVQVFMSPDQLKNLHVGESLATPLIPGWSISIEALLPHEAAPLEIEDE